MPETHPSPTGKEIAYAYCANEIYYGYPCRVEGCPHCGGPDHADNYAAAARAYMTPKPRRKQKRNKCP